MLKNESQVQIYEVPSSNTGSVLRKDSERPLRLPVDSLRVSAKAVLLPSKIDLITSALQWEDGALRWSESMDSVTESWPEY
jgi:hypothetical protein